MPVWVNVFLFVEVYFLFFFLQFYLNLNLTLCQVVLLRKVRETTRTSTPETHIDHLGLPATVPQTSTPTLSAPTLAGRPIESGGGRKGVARTSCHIAARTILQRLQGTRDPNHNIQQHSTTENKCLRCQNGKGRLVCTQHEDSDIAVFTWRKSWEGCVEVCTTLTSQLHDFRTIEIPGCDKNNTSSRSRRITTTLHRSGCSRTHRQLLKSSPSSLGQT